MPEQIELHLPSDSSVEMMDTPKHSDPSDTGSSKKSNSTDFEINDKSKLRDSVLLIVFLMII